MKLYHGTSAAVARRALFGGVEPRGDRKSTWSVASAKDRVYLTDSYALYFAANASGEEDWGIVEIDTTKLYTGNLCPNEDFLEQATREQPNSGCPKGLRTMIQRTKWFRKHSHKGYQKFWEDSLKHLGNCAHLGAIDYRAVTRVAIYDPDTNPYITMRALDPTITLMNYKIVGDTYRALTAWIFDETVTAEELLGKSLTEISPPWVKEQLENAREEIKKRSGIQLIERTQ